jgi:molybdenum cofactor synthesis domain-containing protein
VNAPTAAALIVGAEVLSGKVRDENGPFLAERLRALGVDLLAMHVVPDRMDAIVEALSMERHRVTWVFTSGGVGPTHDDLTLPAVARALGVPLRRDGELETLLRAMHARYHPGVPLVESALRMADLPEGTRRLGDPRFPTLVVGNVVMLPGVPSFLRHQFEAIADTLRGTPFHLACLYLRLGEDQLAEPLASAAARFPAVEIGSYPRFDDADHQVRVTVEGRDPLQVRAATRHVLEALPPGAVVRSEGIAP